MLGAKPIYQFPDGFTYDVCLPPDVAVDIISGKFYPVPQKWKLAARKIVTELPTGPQTFGRQAVPTALRTSGRDPIARQTSGTPTSLETFDSGPTARQTRDHLLEDDDEDDEEERISSHVFKYFAVCKQVSDYTPTEKERQALRQLLKDGFSLAQILNAIDTAFTRTIPKYFTLCARVAREKARSSGHPASETQIQEACSQAESRTPEASSGPQASYLPGQPVTSPNPEPGSQEISQTQPNATLNQDLVRAISAYEGGGREVSVDVVKRFGLMAARCDAAASAAGSNGAAWVAEAVENSLGVALPENLLNYADALLRDWIENGRKSTQRNETGSERKKREKQKDRLADEPRRPGKWRADIG